MDYDVPATPPLIPEAAEVRIEDDQFDLICRSRFKNAAERYNWKYRDVFISRSEKWGILWRADITIPDIAQNLGVNRLMCWYSTDGEVHLETAIAQPIEPLRRLSY